MAQFWLFCSVPPKATSCLSLDTKNVNKHLLYCCRKLIFELDLAQNQTWKVKQEDIVFRDSVNLFEPSVSGIYMSRKRVKFPGGIHIEMTWILLGDFDRTAYRYQDPA